MRPEERTKREPRPQPRTPDLMARTLAALEDPDAFDVVAVSIEDLPQGPRQGRSTRRTSSAEDSPRPKKEAPGALEAHGEERALPATYPYRLSEEHQAEGVYLEPAAATWAGLAALFVWVVFLELVRWLLLELVRAHLAPLAAAGRRPCILRGGQ